MHAFEHWELEKSCDLVVPCPDVNAIFLTVSL